MRVLLLLAASTLSYGQILAPILFGGGGFHWVDSVSGNDSNSGLSAASPWKTVTHADATIAANAPLKLKYPDGSWVAAPPIWHGMQAYMPFWYGGNYDILYDVANGNNASLLATNGLSNSGPYYSCTANGVALDGTTQYADFGASKFGIGTSDQTVSVTANVNTSDASNTVGTFFSNGALGGQAGFGLNTVASASSRNYQIRSAGTVVSAAGSGGHYSVLENYTGTVARASATGLNHYTNGTLDATPVDPTALAGVNLISTQHTAIGTRFSTGTPGFFLAANSVTDAAIFNLTLSSTEVATHSAYALARTFPTFCGSGSYYSPAFREPYASSVLPWIVCSPDGLNWCQKPMTYTLPMGEGFGNAATIRVDATHWWMAHEVTTAAAAQIASSSDGQTFTAVTSTNAIAGGPFWFMDSDASVHLIGAQLTTNTAQESHPTNAAFTTWSVPVSIACTGATTANPQSVVIVLVGSTYYQFYQDSSGGNHYRVCSSSTLTGTYTAIGNLPWGDVESLSILPLSGGGFRAWFSLISGHVNYTSTTANATPDSGWTAAALTPSLNTTNTTSGQTGIGAITVIKLP